MVAIISQGRKGALPLNPQFISFKRLKEMNQRKIAADGRTAKISSLRLPAGSQAVAHGNSHTPACCWYAEPSPLVGDLSKLGRNGRIYPPWSSIIGSPVYGLVEVAVAGVDYLLARLGMQSGAWSDSHAPRRSIS